MIPNQTIKDDRQRGLCRSHGLLFGHDAAVAAWAFNQFARRPSPVDAAVGLIRRQTLVGAALFQNFTGYNVELSYYGPQTFSAGIAKALARYTVERFNVDRLTMRTNRRELSILKMFHSFGFKFEGVQRRYYGPFGDAAVFVMFREDLERIGGLEGKK